MSLCLFATAFQTVSLPLTTKINNRRSKPNGRSLTARSAWLKVVCPPYLSPARVAGADPTGVRSLQCVTIDPTGGAQLPVGDQAPAPRGGRRPH